VADQILVELFDDDAVPEEIDRATLSLREELLGLDDVDDVAGAPAGPAPEGTRGVTLAALGALIVSSGPAVEALGKIVGVLRSWLARSPAPERTLRITVNGQSIELTPTQAQQADLVRAFIDQASRPAT
jgi:hypothetical protein